MYEENNTLTAEETIPAEEGAQSDTQDSTEQERPYSENEGADAEDREGGSNAEAGKDAQEGAPTFKLPVKFYGEHRELTLEEATEYAQKGMNYEKLKSELDGYEANKPVFDKLTYLSQKHGKSIDEIINGLMTADEQMLRREITEKYGDLPDEVVNRLLEQEKSKAQSTYSDYVAQQKEQQAETEKQEHVRIATEFLELQKEFPELESINKVPDSVIIDAVENKRNLIDAYLRYANKESRRIQAAEQAAQVAKKSTPGSLEGGELTHESEAESAFLSGLWK